jgi:predicted transcriptional regulator
MQRKSIGDRELALLNYIGRQSEASVGEVAAGFGESRGLARSTILTMMERLRAKGFLKRRRFNGVFRYSTTAGEKDVLQDSVSAFVEKTLQGSVSPFVAWMSRRGKVSDEELADLEALLEKLQSTRKGD